MEDLNDKINDGGATSAGQLSATEWNQLPSEIQNIIEGLGITLSGGDLNQLGKAIAGYVANGNTYTDSGAANAYVLSAIGSKQAPTAYTEGMRIRFQAANNNTGASTVNVAGLGVKNIKTSSGSDPAADDIATSLLTEAWYDVSAGYFVLSTPADLSDFANLLSANGYQKLPKGFILQWGTGTTDGAGTVTVTYPIAFPTATLAVLATDKATSIAATQIIASSSTPTTTQAVFYAITDAGAAISTPFFWLAIGY